MNAKEFAQRGVIVRDNGLQLEELEPGSDDYKMAKLIGFRDIGVGLHGGNHLMQGPSRARRRRVVGRCNFVPLCEKNRGKVQHKRVGGRRWKGRITNVAVT